MDSLLYTEDFGLATPANWKKGGRLIVGPNVATREARERFRNFELQTLPSGIQCAYVDCPVQAPPAAPAEVGVPNPAGGHAGGLKSDFSIRLGAVMPDFECTTT